MPESLRGYATTGSNEHCRDSMAVGFGYCEACGHPFPCRDRVRYDAILAELEASKRLVVSGLVGRHRVVADPLPVASLDAAEKDEHA